MSAVELDSVVFSYGERPALQGVDFTLEEGKVSALLGPNGGGKTTTFRILSTLIRPDSGSARVLGFDVVKQPLEVRRSVGIVFQASSLDQELTVEENLTHQGHLYGLRGSELSGKIAALLEKFSLSDRSEDRVRDLSGGLKRRADLAKALLHRPRVLLLDEPTSGLDPKVRREFWSYLESLRQEERMSIVLTTHVMNEAERCDCLVILDQGRVVAEGAPQALKKKLGGEIIVLRSDKSAGLKERIYRELGLQATLVNGTVRLEHSDARSLIAELMEKFGTDFESVTVSRPTLEDVFIHETGRTFDAD